MPPYLLLISLSPLSPSSPSHALDSTVENIAVFIWQCLQAHSKMPRGMLYEVLLYETDNQYARYRGATGMQLKKKHTSEVTL